MPLTPVYSLRDENYFRLNLQYRHTKSVKAEDTEIGKSLWKDSAAEVFQEIYRDKCHDPIYHYLRNIIAKRFKRNVARRFLRYMIDNCGPSRSMLYEERRK